MRAKRFTIGERLQGDPAKAGSLQGLELLLQTLVRREKNRLRMRAARSYERAAGHVNGRVIRPVQW